MFAKRATCVPEKAKKRKRVVPANSALVATKWFRAYGLSVRGKKSMGMFCTESGTQPRNGRRFDFSELGLEPLRSFLLFKKGSTNPAPVVGLLIFMIPRSETKRG